MKSYFQIISLFHRHLKPLFHAALLSASVPAVDDGPILNPPGPSIGKSPGPPQCIRGYGRVERIRLLQASRLLRRRTNTENRCRVFYHYLSGSIVFQYIQPLLSEHSASNTRRNTAIKERENYSPFTGVTPAILIYRLFRLCLLPMTANVRS